MLFVNTYVYWNITKSNKSNGKIYTLIKYRIIKESVKKNMFVYNKPPEAEVYKNVATSIRFSFDCRCKSYHHIFKRSKGSRWAIIININ